MRALLYAALFFETCSDEQCDLDTAVKQLEGIAAELDGLTASDRAEFRAFAQREAAAHPVPAVSEEIARVIDALLAAN
jgi:peroxiredoxin